MSGYMCMVRSWELLLEVWYDHDNDNIEGVIVVMDMCGQLYVFYVFGDWFLLGKVNLILCMFSWDVFSCVRYLIFEMVMLCIFKYQCGILVVMFVVSLLDWVFGGLVFIEIYEICLLVIIVEGFICCILLVCGMVVSGLYNSGLSIEVLVHGMILVLLLDYVYEFISIWVGLQISSNML